MTAPRAKMPRARIVVMAHNEERRIATCLSSLPLGDPGIEAHVIVNGSSDRTAEIARRFDRADVREYAQGGKARSWNRFALDEAEPAEAFVFVDGDAEIAAGSIDALLATLQQHPDANAAAALPLNGRGVEAYRQFILEENGLFGDLYALRGNFVDRLRASGVRLPQDVIGDDSLVGALAKTDLGREDDWRDNRIQPCLSAGFLCEPTQITPASLTDQYKRMVNYSVRHYQNRIISDIMRGPGPGALPERLSSHYARWLPRFARRRHPLLWWVDRAALKRMEAAA
ncbi:MAG: glycosyltransferase family A protein [Pseudomonadota bacterium]